MDDWLGPSGWQAIFAGVTGFVTGAAVGIAWTQLRHIARSSTLEALHQLYTSYIDDPEKRALRRRVHQVVTGDSNDPAPSDLDRETWDAVERTATAFDAVGLMVHKGLVDEDLVMERYLEVIIPLWPKVKPYLEYRRAGKGGGWEYFERLYERAERYRLRHYPHRDYRSFTPQERRPTWHDVVEVCRLWLRTTLRGR
jgi:hypothetical protein